EHAAKTLAPRDRHRGLHRALRVETASIDEDVIRVDSFGDRELPHGLGLVRRSISRAARHEDPPNEPRVIEPHRGRDAIMKGERWSPVGVDSRSEDDDHISLSSI